MWTGSTRMAAWIWMGIPFIYSTKKGQTVHFLSDFREVINELNRLSDLGVLEFHPASEWAAPSFIISKMIVCNQWELNKWLVRKPFPLPKISTVMQELEGFTFATALDLNMGYYTIKLDQVHPKCAPFYFLGINTHTSGYLWALMALLTFFM